MEIFDKLTTRFATVTKLHEQYKMLTIEAPVAAVHDVLAFLQQEGYAFLTTLCGVHFPNEKAREMCVMYQLHDLPNNLRIRVKTFVSSDNPQVPTATDLFPAANWMERQEFDFFGIDFVGHPDLRRILNMDDLGVHPMLKEYRLEDGTRTDKDDRFFGRDQHEGQTFERRTDRVYLAESN
jgi:NADH-quinone oxidoreductase subunit C